MKSASVTTERMDAGNAKNVAAACRIDVEILRSRQARSLSPEEREVLSLYLRDLELATRLCDAVVAMSVAVDGLGRCPTPDEVTAHQSAGGSWLVSSGKASVLLDWPSGIAEALKSPGLRWVPMWRGLPSLLPPMLSAEHEVNASLAQRQQTMKWPMSRQEAEEIAGYASASTESALKRSESSDSIDFRELCVTHAADLQAVVWAARSLVEFHDIVAGLGRNPTAEEIGAHYASGGSWLVFRERSGLSTLSCRLESDVIAAARRGDGTWLPLRGGMPCAPPRLDPPEQGTLPGVQRDRIAKSAAEVALDQIAEACGCPEWQYPGQVVRDVEAIVSERNAARLVAGSAVQSRLVIARDVYQRAHKEGADAAISAALVQVSDSGWDDEEDGPQEENPIQASLGNIVIHHDAPGDEWFGRSCSTPTGDGFEAALKEFESARDAIQQELDGAREEIAFLRGEVDRLSRIGLGHSEARQITESGEEIGQ